MQTLIVPVDGSSTSWAAVDVAATLARRFDARLRIVGVEFDRCDVDEAREHLEHTLRESPLVDVDVDLDVRLGSDTVASEIESLVEADAGATVVMTSRGRGRSAALLGSVADDILRRTFGPIVLVGPGTDTGHDFTGPVVVSTDGSEQSHLALPLAAAWAIELGVEPWIVHVVEPDVQPPSGGDVFDSAYLARLARDLRDRCGHEVGYETLRDQHPAVAVPRYAEQVGASLIVASSHGRSGLSRLSMGSVTSGFVRRATCPVLVIRPPAT